MNCLRSLAYGIAAGATLAALALPVDKAEARVIAYSTLQISNFKITDGADTVDPASVSVANTTRSDAHLNGLSNSGFLGSNANSDVQSSCVGQCDGIGENNLGRHSLMHETSTFARADAQLTGSLLGGGANGSTVAETQLAKGVNTSAAGSSIQSTANFTTFDFETEGFQISLQFDVFGELLAFSDEEGGRAQADFELQIILRDLTGNSVVPIDISSNGGKNDFSSLSNGISAFNIETQSYSIDDTFFLTVNGLLANNNYRLEIRQNIDVSARSIRRVAEPASMGLLGLGLLGLGGMARRRKTV